MRIQGLAYVPGCVQGVLRRRARAIEEGDILLLSQEDIPRLSGRPAGIVLRDGAPFSHRTIGLLALGVPGILISEEDAQGLCDGMPVVLDGTAGILSDADGQAAPPSPPAPPQAAGPVLTADGVPVYLAASVRDRAAAGRALAAGASSIGLVRSEFLVPAEARTPDAAFYRESFAQLCEAAAPLEVTIRLLDAAVDKRPDWLPGVTGFGSALGMQGVRLYSDTRIDAVVQAQLRAIAAIAADHPLQVLMPYLVRREELVYWTERLRPCLPEGLALGAMIETPAAALDLGSWFGHADFITVGCNDLMQCLFAADRDNPAVAAYLDPYAPLLYRLLRQVAEGAVEHLDKVRLCGVLPQLRGVLPILLGLGFRTFSVDAVHIPYLAQTIGGTDLATARAQADAVCRSIDSRRVLDLLGLPADGYRPYRT